MHLGKVAKPALLRRLVRGYASHTARHRVDEEQEAFLYAGKHTANPPFCDGTRNGFTQDQVGKKGPGEIAKSEGQPSPRNTKDEPNLALIN